MSPSPSNGTVGTTLEADGFLCKADGQHTPFLNQTLSSSSANATLFVTKLQSSVAILNAHDLQPQQSFTAVVAPAATTGRTPGDSRSAHASILGVAFSPTGTHLAAYTTDQLLIAAAAQQGHSSAQQPSSQPGRHQPPLGQLHHAATIPGGIRAVHWSPSGSALAVCCKSKPEVMLFDLVDESAPHPHATADQHSTPAHNTSRQHHCCLTPAVTLPGPQHATRGPTAATWLPGALTTTTSSSSSSSSSGSSSVSGPLGLSCSSSGSRAMLGLLVSWTSSLMLFTWEDPSTHSVIKWDAYVMCEILTGWPGPVRSLLTLDPTAQHCTAGNSTTHHHHHHPASGSVTGTTTLVVAAVDAPPAWHQHTAGGGTQLMAQLTASSSSTTADTHAGELQALPSAAAAAGGADTVSVGGAPVLFGQGASSSGVLDSLFNITGSHIGQQQQHHSPAGVLQGLSSSSSYSRSEGIAGAEASVLAAAAPSYLCLLPIDLPWFRTQPAAGREGHSAGCQQQKPCPVTAADLHSGPIRGCVNQGSYVTVLPLPQQPLASCLAARGALVAVGSSTGDARVTLCAVSESSGLQLLQTVQVPLPQALIDAGAASARASADPGTSSSSQSRQVRLQGLLLLRSGSPLITSSDAPTAGGSGVELSTTSVLALLACCDKAAQPPVGFSVGFGGSRASQASDADLHLVKFRCCAPPASLPSGPQQQPCRNDAAAAAAEAAQQKAGGSVDSGSQAVVAALQALQVSLESRLDAMQATMQRMDARLQALERRDRS